MDIHATEILFEILPPPSSWEAEKVIHWIDLIRQVMQEEALQALNLPEVLEEARDEERIFSPLKKFDNVRISTMLQRRLTPISCIPNKVVVRSSKNDFSLWLEQLYALGIRQLFLIGGEKHTIHYPGYSVEEAAMMIKRQFPDIAIGGITIFTRHDEAMRIFKKMQCGITFFCSQIVFETDNLKQVVSELIHLCSKEGVPFPKIFVSLSPAAQLKDLHFIKWLGAEFPSAIYSFLTRQASDVETRSFLILERLLDEIFHFKNHSNINLGFNVEHVCYTNLHLAAKLIHIIRAKMSTG